MFVNFDQRKKKKRKNIFRKQENSQSVHTYSKALAISLLGREKNEKERGKRSERRERERKRMREKRGEKRERKGKREKARSSSNSSFFPFHPSPIQSNWTMDWAVGKRKRKEGEMQCFFLSGSLRNSQVLSFSPSLPFSLSLFLFLALSSNYFLRIFFSPLKFGSHKLQASKRRDKGGLVKEKRRKNQGEGKREGMGS